MALVWWKFRTPFDRLCCKEIRQGFQIFAWFSSFRSFSLILGLQKFLDLKPFLFVVNLIESKVFDRTSVKKIHLIILYNLYTFYSKQFNGSENLNFKPLNPYGQIPETISKKRGMTQGISRKLFPDFFQILQFWGVTQADPDIVSKLFLLRKRIISRRHVSRGEWVKFTPYELEGKSGVRP